MKTRNFIKYFFSDLYNAKIYSEEISKEDKSKILDLSNKFLLSNVLKRSIIRSESDNDHAFFQILNRQHFLNTIVKERLLNFSKVLAKKLNSQNIDYCFLKGTALSLRDNKNLEERFYRDIDILVNDKNIDDVYEILKNFGFKYSNPLVNDTTIYRKKWHQLPPLINNEGIIVEIHHRITCPSIYKKCHITDLALKSKEKIQGIKCISCNLAIIHALYHGTLHHDNKIGPKYLYDIKTLHKLSELDSDFYNLLKIMKLENEFKSSLRVINSKDLLPIKDYKKYLEFNSTNKLTYFFSSLAGFNILRKKILRKFSTLSERYQVQKYSIKFLFVFLVEIKNFFLRRHKIKTGRDGRI